MISQLGYLQKQYISQLSQISELRDLQKLQVRLRNQQQETETHKQSNKTTKSIEAATADMLQNAASFVSDPKLSQALLRLASNKK